jgi:hypothetical protein
LFWLCAGAVSWALNTQTTGYQVPGGGAVVVNLAGNDAGGTSYSSAEGATATGVCFTVSSPSQTIFIGTNTVGEWNSFYNWALNSNPLGLTLTCCGCGVGATCYAGSCCTPNCGATCSSVAFTGNCGQSCGADCGAPSFCYAGSCCTPNFGAFPCVTSCGSTNGTQSDGCGGSQACTGAPGTCYCPIGYVEAAIQQNSTNDHSYTWCDIPGNVIALSSDPCQGDTTNPYQACTATFATVDASCNIDQPNCTGATPCGSPGACYRQVCGGQDEYGFNYNCLCCAPGVLDTCIDETTGAIICCS